MEPISCKLGLGPSDPFKKMRRLRIGIVDLVAGVPSRSLYARVLFPNFASIMPQAIAVWCERAGHDVRFACYTGSDDISCLLPGDLDMLFVCAFTHAAYMAYATSSLYRSKGAVTVLGGPHARAFPNHARKYFDYVLGLTDEDLLGSILQDCQKHRPLGLQLSAKKQPPNLPGVRDRWKYVKYLHSRTILPSTAILGSLGCPYTCSFCVDAEIPYQTLEFDSMKEDLRFLQRRMRRPRVVWHDPNFGVQFDRYLDLIEEAVPPGSIEFIAESSLSLLSESRLPRLKRNGFKAVLPGIESWYELGNKSGSGKSAGLRKMQDVTKRVQLILSQIPYVQTNFVFGLDSDEGEEPFELTKQFIESVPGVFPACALLTSYGQSAPLSRSLSQQGRVTPVPFPFLYSGFISNVKPLNYSWPAFYRAMESLLKHAFSWRMVRRRAQAVRGSSVQTIHLIRALSAEGRGRVAQLAYFRQRLETDIELRDFIEGASQKVPEWMTRKAREDLGSMRCWLPESPLSYNCADDAPSEVLVPRIASAGLFPANDRRQEDSQSSPS